MVMRLAIASGRSGRTAARSDRAAAALHATQLLLARIAADLDGAAPGTVVAPERGWLTLPGHVTRAPR